MLMSRSGNFIALGLAGLLLLCFQGSTAPQKTSATRYLAFQVFTNAPDPQVPIGGSGRNPLSSPPTRAAMSQFVQRLVKQIGTTGDPKTKLAFIIGPLAFDHTDQQLRQMIADAFQIALEQDIAVGFHIDDSLFLGPHFSLG
jgi:hypothetical protein